MHHFAAAAALMGLSTLASAAPWMAPPSYSKTSSWNTKTSTSASSTSTSSGQVDFVFPLANGFPDLQKNSSAVETLQETAQGTIPGNVPVIANATTSSLTTADVEDVFISLGFIAFNELFEVAFFSELIANITAGGSGFENVPNKDFVLKTLKVVLAQEELHELNANLAFKSKTNGTILPCKYDFPVNNFTDAIGLASTFTDVVLGTLPDIQTIFGEANQSGLIRGVGAVIGQEGEQNGFYRQILGKVPSALPFLTASARDFAFSAINQQFVVPNSCPSLDLLEVNGHALKIFKKLKVDTQDISTAHDSIIEFTAFPLSESTASYAKSYASLGDYEGLYITYVNQQNPPISFPIDFKSISLENGIAKFPAPFQGQKFEMNGLTIAAVTSGSDFAGVDDVAAATIFGPGLIEIN